MNKKYVNERMIMIITTVGLFYYLYTKYLDLSERQDYLERNVVGVVEHLNKLTIDEVVREVSENDTNTDVDSTAAEVGDHITRTQDESDEEYSYIQSDEHIDTEEENYDKPREEPDDETIIIGGTSRTGQVKGSQCSIVLHSGKRKGFVCGKPATDGYCGIHKKRIPKPMDATPLEVMDSSC